MVRQTTAWLKTMDGVGQFMQKVKKSSGQRGNNSANKGQKRSIPFYYAKK
jgi:hypothetical protein